MRKTLLTLCLLSCCLLCHAQHPGREVSSYLAGDPHRYAFNIHSYEVVPHHDTPAPRGYKPFYISHYGRHGSRGSWGCEPYMRVEDILIRARGEGILTSGGDSLLAIATYVKESQWAMDGELTPRGLQEHRGIAERMYRRFPSVFKKGSRTVRAASSTVPRCILSMNAFTARLASLQPSLNFSWVTGWKYMDYISKADTKEIQERRGVIVESLEWEPLQDSVSIYRRLFTDPEKGKILAPDWKGFENDIFTTAMVAEPYGVDDNYFRFLPEEMLVLRYAQSVTDAYLGQCNSLELGEDRMKRTEDLVNVIVRQADEVIEGGGVSADLCFGHDWPYLGLCSRFGLEGVGDRMDAKTARDNWMGTKYCPLAANLQIVFYKAKKNPDILVKVLVNEEETRIPALDPVAGPYYRWEDVKGMLGIK
ncbi:MAG: hypothetical protein IKX05_04180 [Bacteroidales bacterium]|nr:hypothetical protein [Bacteroidales bacterium]MBR5063896.1 hypothetical protein [Bacteroidales bacterium]